jgi:hypothetical protein
MWLCLRDAFLSVVSKDCPKGSLLVRARRAGDIERLFPNAKIVRDTTADYLFRAAVPIEEIAAALVNELQNVNYGNFKSSVRDGELHSAYLDVWNAMARIQHPGPYSERRHSSPTRQPQFAGITSEGGVF